MGRIYRIRIRGKQRPHPDVALLAQAIIELGRQLREQERQAQAATKPAPSRRPENPSAEHGEASA